MELLPGQTRSSVQANHALIAPDSHVASALPGWEKTQGIMLISPQLRGLPRFTQYLASMDVNASAGKPSHNVQRFVYVLAGTLELNIAGQEFPLNQGYYTYVPANTEHSLIAKEQSTLLIFEKPYTPSNVTDEKVSFHTGNAWEVQGKAFMGDDDTLLRVLLPADIQYDMAVNLFTFQPGAVLGLVETHIMEHGLYMLEGQGIYRLDERYYPVQADDTIWMGSYCPQWFCAYGKTQSTYIYYKDINRDPLS